MIEIPYCKLSEIESKHFLKKFHKCINDWHYVQSGIMWKTRGTQSLFPLKDKNDCKLCVTYKGDCSCDSCYFGETKHNAKVRWNENNNLT